MHRQTYSFSMKPFSQRSRGFTLVELLTVMAIMALLVSVSIPALSGMRSTYARAGSVDLVMDTIEQAREAALQSGENTYVILALSQDSGVSPDALMVAGDQPIGSTSTDPLVLYTPWKRLPTNIRFRSSADTLVTNALPAAVQSQTSTLPRLNGNPVYYGFTFNSTGEIVNPILTTVGLDVALYEGIRDSSGNETAEGASAKATQNLQDSGLYEVIRLSRYSGRSWMNVSTLLQK